MQPNPLPSNVVSFKPQSFVPPNSLEIEEAVIGGILLDPNAIERLVDTLSAEHFYLGAHQEIYKCVITLQHHAIPIDLMSVAGWLKDRGMLDKVGGQSKLVQLLDPVVSAVNIDHYADVLIQKWNRREIIRVSREIAALAHDESIPEDSMQNDIEALFTGLFLQSRQKTLKPISEFVQDEIERIGSLMTGQEEPGVSTGFYDLDEKMIGLRPAKLGIIAGRPGMGKSALLGSIAENIAVQGKNVAIFSLEMDGGEIAQRLIAAQTSIDSARFQKGNLDQASFDKVCATMDHFSGTSIWIDDSSNIGVNHIRSKVRELQLKSGVDVVMVDYLHLMLDSENDEDVRAIGRITRSLKNLSRELNVNIQLLSQLSRAVEQRSDKRPVMSDLRQSGSIEQDADTIVFIYRDEYYNPESPDRGIAELILAKNRSGAIGTVKLLFEPQYSRFRNLANPDHPPTSVPKKPSQPPSQPASPQPKKEPQPTAEDDRIQLLIESITDAVLSEDNDAIAQVMNELTQLENSEKTAIWNALDSEQQVILQRFRKKRSREPERPKSVDDEFTR